MGAGMRPVRAIMSAHENFETDMTGAWPRSPPKFTTSPTFLPATGITRTAVVFWFTIPIAASSAMMPEIVYAGVSPGMAIMSRPTEQTHVIASSFSMESAPAVTASIIPWSSATGMNAPESPPT